MTTTDKSYTRHGPKADEAAARIIEREILACQSSLVEELMRQARDLDAAMHEPGNAPPTVYAFDFSNVENLYPDPSEWTAEECANWLDDHEVDYGGVELPPGRGVAESEEYDSELRELVRDHADPAEIYEWWLVTGWLCDKLHEAGEPVLDNNYGTWWGRTRTGQAIILDGTIQDIAVKAGMVQ